MTRHVLSVALGLLLTYSSWLGAAEPGQPAPAQASDPFEQTLLQMEQILARLRATRDPGERQRLLRQQARSLYKAMRLAVPRGPGMVHPPGQVGQGMGPPNRRGPGGRTWGPAPRAAGGESAGVKPEQPVPGHRQGTRYAEMARRMDLLQQRLDEQQLVLEEILKYREPFEQLLLQQGIGQ